MSSPPTRVCWYGRGAQGRAGFRLAGWLAVLLTLSALSVRADLHITAPSHMPIGRHITAEQLWQEFDRTLPSGVWISPLENREYEVVSAVWMRRDFLPALKQQMKTLWAEGIPTENSAGNCSGFAMVCRLMLGLSAMEAHALAPATATVIVYQGKPFGGLSATKEDHCVAFVLTDEGPWIIEVQSGTYVNIFAYPNRDTIKLVSVH
jgi:hypothetical protein